MEALPFMGWHTLDEGVLNKSLLLQAGLCDWLDGVAIPVVNRLASLGSCRSRPYQHQLMQRCGLLVPPTLITNDPDEVMAFQQRHGRVVCQSMEAFGFVSWELKGRWELNRVRQWPGQFQSWIQGVRVRVHVVGSALFATQVVGVGEESRMIPVHLPVDVCERCLVLSVQLGLPLCGIDLKCGVDGEYYGLEVDPFPVYSDYELATGQPITSAIIDYLSR